MYKIILGLILFTSTMLCAGNLQTIALDKKTSMLVFSTNNATTVRLLQNDRLLQELTVNMVLPDGVKISTLNLDSSTTENEILIEMSDALSSIGHRTTLIIYKDTYWRFQFIPFEKYLIRLNPKTKENEILNDGLLNNSYIFKKGLFQKNGS